MKSAARTAPGGAAAHWAGVIALASDDLPRATRNAEQAYALLPSPVTRSLSALVRWRSGEEALARARLAEGALHAEGRAPESFPGNKSPSTP